MEVSARLSSKGQVTVPARSERRCRSKRAIDSFSGWKVITPCSREPRISSPWRDPCTVPAARRGTPWTEVLRQTRRTRAAERR